MKILKLINQAALATEMGISRQALNKKIQRGLTEQEQVLKDELQKLI